MAARLLLNAIAGFALLSVGLATLYERHGLRISVTDVSLKRNLMFCYCSPSGRGYHPSARRGLRTILERLDNDLIAIKKKGQSITTPRIRRAVLSTIHKASSDCTRRYGVESCINADAALRSILRVQYCHYHTPTGKNVARPPDGSKLVCTLAPCNESIKYSSTAAQRGQVNSRPSGGNGGSRNENSSNGSGTENGTRNEKPSITTTEMGNWNESGPRRLPSNEGCVAVEHLKGYKLQHRKHLLRQVLCGRGFCATPNHAIEFAGKLTSMKILCSVGGWKCVSHIKLVNNLKLSANRRAVLGDIVITPYDLRFPRAFIWVMQIVEDALDLLLFSFALGISVAAGLWSIFIFDHRTRKQVSEE